MAVEELGGVADGVRGDGLLALDVQAPGGFRGEDHLKVQAGKEGKPEGEILYIFSPKGMPILPRGAVSLSHAVEGAEVIIFEF